MSVPVYSLEGMVPIQPCFRAPDMGHHFAWRKREAGWLSCSLCMPYLDSQQPVPPWAIL